MNDSIFETPEISIVAFNGNYERLAKIISSNTKEAESIIEDMASSIWQFCNSLIGGSPTMKLIKNNLKQVFVSNTTMELDDWGPMKIIVKSPSEATNQIQLQISSKSSFQFGYLLLEVEGNPIIKKNNKDVYLLNYLRNLHDAILNKS